MSDDVLSRAATRATESERHLGGADLGGSDLVGRTFRTVVLLVAACVLFVGALSAGAVFLASKAVSASPAAVEIKSTEGRPPVSI
jgi:hypothetical protein